VCTSLCFHSPSLNRLQILNWDIQTRFWMGTFFLDGPSGGIANVNWLSEPKPLILCFHWLFLSCPESTKAKLISAPLVFLLLLKYRYLRFHFSSGSFFGHRNQLEHLNLPACQLPVSLGKTVPGIKLFLDPVSQMPSHANLLWPWKSNSIVQKV